jgi:hypothetical protein
MRRCVHIKERSLRCCQYRRVFIAPLPTDNNNILGLNFSLPHLKHIPKYSNFIAPLKTSIQYVVNKRLLTELYAPLAIRILIANSCTRWRGIFKSSQRTGDSRIFPKISSTLSLINTYQMNLVSAGFISLYSTFNRRRESRPWKSERQSAPTSDNQQSTTITRQSTRLTTRNQQQLPTEISIWQSTVNNHHPTTDTPDNQELPTITDRQQHPTINSQQPSPDNRHAWQPGINNNFRQTAAPANQQSLDYCWLSTNKYTLTDTPDDQNQHQTTNRQKSTGWKYSKTRLEATTSSAALPNHNPHFWQQ